MQYMDISIVNVALHSLQHCKVMCSIFWQLHPMIFIVGALTKYFALLGKYRNFQELVATR